MFHSTPFFLISFFFFRIYKSIYKMFLRVIGLLGLAEGETICIGLVGCVFFQMNPTKVARSEKSIPRLVEEKSNNSGECQGSSQPKCPSSQGGHRIPFQLPARCFLCTPLFFFFFFSFKQPNSTHLFTCKQTWSWLKCPLYPHFQFVFPLLYNKWKRDFYL